MKLNLFVWQNGEKVPVSMVPASLDDLQTFEKEPSWQTNWTSEYIQQKGHLNYALKTEDGKVIGLGCYELKDEMLAVYVAFVESEPNSNPVLTDNRVYSGIGKALFAYGVELSFNAGFGGVIYMEAKSERLFWHYIKVYGAEPVPYHESGYGRVILFEDAAQELIKDYERETQ